jgi:hypothetical protein
LFLHLVRSRVKTNLIISTATEHELRAYVPWAARHVMMAPDEILVRVVDRALDEYFKRDRLWRQERESVLREAALSRWRSIGARPTGSGSPPIDPSDESARATTSADPTPSSGTDVDHAAPGKTETAPPEPGGRSG